MIRLRCLRRPSALALLGALSLFVVACVVQGPRAVQQHRWWSGLGPVLPHDSFPADCTLCHVGDDWYSLVENFQFDHERQSGVPLTGSHAQAGCLRCHNDRGPVDVFARRGCAGCHEDLHLGQLGQSCESCHQQNTWQPIGQVERHYQTRFPLVGVHATTACHRCHAGAEVGRFVPTDIECVTCHASDLLRAVNPNHIGLGWVDKCNRCHQPTTWSQAEL